MHPPGMETGIDPSSFPHSSILGVPGHGEWGGRWGRGGVTAKNPSGILPQPPAALLKKAQGAPYQRLVSPLPKERTQRRTPASQKKPPGTCQISPFPQRGTFCPDTKTLLHLLSDELDGVFILHPTLNQGQRDKDGSAERQKQWLSLPSHAAQRLISII